jgi:virulence factor Mce-like protein
VRRAAGSILVLVVLAVALVLVFRDAESGSPAYRVDAVFDNARGLVGGQVVKVAGARVGKIVDVSLTSRYQARVEMEVDSRFAPFRSNARCTIRPEGLIAENYVQCDPGTSDKPKLAGRGGQAPTVPAGRNTEPVSLTDLFNIFDTPTRERLSVIVNELGIGVAGRGEDLNAIIRRANPSLELTRRALTIINGQRSQLGTAIDSSDRLIARLAQRSGRAQQFIASAARVTDRIARHRDDVSQIVARMPPLLSEGRGALRQLDTVTATGTPLLRSLREAAPQLNRVSADIPAFARAAPAALRGLGTALKQGTPTARRLLPVVRAVRGYAQRSLPEARVSGRLYTNLRERGFIENMLSLFYYGAAGFSRYDSVSHILPAHILTNQDCLMYATTAVPGCSANYKALDYLMKP